jgi:glutamine cyclotransferase
MRNRSHSLFSLTCILAFSVFSFFKCTTAVAETRPDVEKSGSYRAGIGIEVVEKVVLPKGYHEGLYHDGRNIWVNNGTNINTWVISPEGEVLEEIIPPGTFTEGIADSDVPGKFWVTDWDTKMLYRVSVVSGKMEPEKEIFLGPAFPAGVARAGETLYVITWTRGLGTRYHLLQLDKNGNILHRTRIKGIFEPSQIAWDGRYLWITSWYNRRIYQLDPVDLSILGHFVSPAKETTGIAWDGEFFWITGTYDDLYKVRIDI